MLLFCYLVVGSNECISLMSIVVFFEKIINTNFLLHTSKNKVINETNKRTNRVVNVSRSSDVFLSGVLKESPI